MDECRERRKMIKRTNKDGKCKQIRGWLYDAVRRRFGLEADWAQRHIANCPRCQQRLASLGKVNLALSIVKSQPHGVDLLMRANTAAVGVLKHSLRNSETAAKLKAARSEVSLLCRCRRYARPVGHTAACLTILALAKTGLFGSADNFQSEGRDLFKQYYASHVGQDMADDMFSA
jgi:hypothetical protein